MFSMTGTDANRELISTALSVLKDSPEVSSLFNLGGTINFLNGGRMKNEHIHVPSGDNMLRTVVMYVCEKGWNLEAVERDPELGMINVVLSKGEQDPYAGVVLISMTGTDANRELISTALSVLKDSPEVSSLFNLGGTINFLNGGRMKNEHIHVPSGDNMLRTVVMYVCEKGWNLEAVERDPELGIINVVLSKGEQDPYAGVVLNYAAQ